MGWPTGFAPATTSATDWCSAVELRPPYFYYTIIAGAPGRIRTPNTRSEAWRDIHFTTRALRSTQGKLFLLDQVYTELIFDERSGAGERNRTVALTLEGSRSTIKLHPHFAITERSSNLFRATISAMTGRNPAQRFRNSCISRKAKQKNFRFLN